MKRIMFGWLVGIFVFTSVCLHGGVVPVYAQEGESAVQYTVAVLPFESSGAEIKELGPQVTLLINTYLSTNEQIALVERGELDKALSEIEMGMSGLVTNQTAAKIGQLTGAKILVTGRVFPVQNELFMVGKIIGTETSQVFAEAVSMSMRESHADMVEELANKIASTIVEKGDVLVAKSKQQVDSMENLKYLVEDIKKLPSVSVNIDERHIGRPVLDPAAETEISLMLQDLGFDLLDKTAKDQPDIEIKGQAFSEFGMRNGNLVSCKARVEVKAIERTTGKVIAIDRQSEVAVDISEQIAGKAAIEKASRKIAERMIPRILKSIEG